MFKTIQNINIMAEENKTLHLSLLKKYWDMIIKGKKTEEYRDVTPYWASKLLGTSAMPVNGYWDDIVPKYLKTRKQYPHFKTLVEKYGARRYSAVCFHLNTGEAMTYEYKGLEQRRGRMAVGTSSGEYFVIKLGKRIG